MTFDLTKIRAQFPALNRSEIFFDNPGGTQIAIQSLDQIVNYLTRNNANHGGAFLTSQKSDETLDKAHAAVADFLNAARPEEIVFGPNMTTLTLALSRSLARTFQPGDTLLVTRLDHDANITPWTLVAEERGCKVIYVDFSKEDGVLCMEEMQAALEQRPKLVAVGYASNALGTINPVAKIVEMAHQAGALVFIDAVQYAAHGPIDVQNIGCDFLAISAYKFFGPHVGMLYGRYDLMDELFAYKVRPAPNNPPGKFETGTQNHEGIAGVLGAIEYLEWVGSEFCKAQISEYLGLFTGRKLRLKQAMAGIKDYEFTISRALLDVFSNIQGLSLHGLKDPNRVDERVPTFSFTYAGKSPRRIAEELAQSGIFVWDGNYYALAVTERLGLENSGGMVRVGPVHYNSLEEVNRLAETLDRISS
jgi:cysteine desulfurase family protein (TIGR01976 family)